MYESKMPFYKCLVKVFNVYTSKYIIIIIMKYWNTNQTYEAAMQHSVRAGVLLQFL